MVSIYLVGAKQGHSGGRPSRIFGQRDAWKRSIHSLRSGPIRGPVLPAQASARSPARQGPSRRASSGLGSLQPTPIEYVLKVHPSQSRTVQTRTTLPRYKLSQSSKVKPITMEQGSVLRRIYAVVSRAIHRSRWESDPRHRAPLQKVKYSIVVAWISCSKLLYLTIANLGAFFYLDNLEKPCIWYVSRRS